MVLFIIYYHIVCAVTWLSDAIIDWNMMSTKNVCCAENRFKIFVWHFCQPCCVVEICNNTTYLSKDSILVLTIVIICNCWSSKNQVDGQTKIERVFVESAVVIFVIFLPVHCVRCGGRQVRPAAKSERILGVASPPWVLGGKSTWCKWQLFCNPPRCSSVCFESLSSILGCSALRHIFVFCPLAVLRSCARSCQPGWWRPTVKGSGWGRPAEVELDRWVVLLTQPHLIYAGAPQRRHPAPLVASSRTLLGISAFCGGGTVLLRRSGLWQIDKQIGVPLTIGGTMQGRQDWQLGQNWCLSTNVSDYKCVFYQTASAFNIIVSCNKQSDAVVFWKRRSIGQPTSRGQAGRGGDRIGMMKFEKPRRHLQISFIRLLLPRFLFVKKVQYNLI